MLSVVTDMCRQMARTRDSSSDSDSDSASCWRRPPPSDDECDDAIMLKSHQLRSLQRDPNIVLSIRVMIALETRAFQFMIQKGVVCLFILDETICDAKIGHSFCMFICGHIW